MNDVVNSYYGFPEEEIFDDTTLTDNEKKVKLGDLLRNQEQQGLFTLSGENQPEDPIQDIHEDVLALVLFWSDTDVTPPIEHGGSRYNYWCNILRDNTKQALKETPTSGAGPVVKRLDETFSLSKVMMSPRPQDIKFSKKIIDYYKLKLSHRALTSDIPFSEYEIKLSNFINTGPSNFKLDELGVIVRLPETYNVDLIFDKFIDKYDSLPSYEEPWSTAITSQVIPERKPLVLNFIKKVNVLGSREINIRYYFENDNILYCMRFGEKNPLLSVLDHVLETKNNVLNITASVTPTVLYANSDFWYNTIHDDFVLNAKDFVWLDENDFVLEK